MPHREADDRRLPAYSASAGPQSAVSARVSSSALSMLFSRAATASISAAASTDDQSHTQRWRTRAQQGRSAAREPQRFRQSTPPWPLLLRLWRLHDRLYRRSTASGSTSINLATDMPRAHAGGGAGQGRRRGALSARGEAAANQWGPAWDVESAAGWPRQATLPAILTSRHHGALPGMCPRRKVPPRPTLFLAHARRRRWPAGSVGSCDRRQAGKMQRCLAGLTAGSERQRSAWQAGSATDDEKQGVAARAATSD